jgi:subtilisin family serine protease
LRKIVVLRPHEWLRDSYRAQVSASAVSQLKAIERPGMRFLDEPAAPVPVTTPTREVLAFPGDTFSTPLGHQFMAVAEFDSEGVAEDLVRTEPDVEGVFVDPEIAPCPVVCPVSPVGSVADVRTHIQIGPVHAAGHRGQGVRVAIVDTGIDGSTINVSGGLNMVGFPAPGTSTPPDHGNMVAFDALIAAPNAMILDYPLLRSVAGGGWVGFLSDAIRIYAELMVLILQVPGPLVVVNSWAMYNRSQDRPVGHPQNYSANPKHPFNQILGSLVGAGADVLFAAGNCGSMCPDGRCGVGDKGPGNSIHGANSHPDAYTVAAVTHTGNLLGYSSEGPAGLFAQKPDLAGTSHFVGSGVFPEDAGTSAACPVVAGVVAALRSKPSARSLAPGVIKQAILTSAVQPPGVSPGWNGQTGFGVVNAAAAQGLV